MKKKNQNLRKKKKREKQADENCETICSKCMSCFQLLQSRTSTLQEDTGGFLGTSWVVGRFGKRSIFCLFLT
jgi:hypothetical protein